MLGLSSETYLFLSAMQAQSHGGIRTRHRDNANTRERDVAMSLFQRISNIAITRERRIPSGHAARVSLTRQRESARTRECYLAMTLYRENASMSRLLVAWSRRMSAFDLARTRYGDVAMCRERDIALWRYRYNVLEVGCEFRFGQ